MKANQNVRNAMKEKGVAAWQIGDILGVSDMTIFRRLRRPLSPEDEAKIMGAIQEAAREG